MIEYALNFGFFALSLAVLLNLWRLFRGPSLMDRVLAVDTMVINIIVSGMAGVLVPVTFDRLDQDPAVASSVFVTMITDSMGFLAFLGLAVATGLVSG